MNENELSNAIIGLAMRVHTALGPGLLESTYEACLEYEINKAGFKVEQQKPLPLIYKDVELECGYRVDLIVENKLILEIKAVESLHPIHSTQLLTYLKLSKCKLGLLINFNLTHLKDGIKRIVNGL
ncbi:MAG TPA: GxxExxY protein [Cyanobacteria bacterium UBA11149]|nr:GxxExxY protein [Cyanobacteria bacterium UBA11367]HBE58910.1 GxxExxY protein [Cyanobacteria bacterium UBA11366]HBK66777.1 GxxExxY protein [Cyanobacteria bacterium UBA11166]HBR72207.1 GxxExxY protein [Cyanobacteria bacterium UBA11159]HBS69670.1 GxxExxY protein [Cyanobacteria bacterium UBA11153]HBW88222.1 GxxExxY protein [Cyanobacteria bacterium UBA11149]HCA95578.1 GxxExxY protein [Cyanobacteria bacterium UBA9226]